MALRIQSYVVFHPTRAHKNRRLEKERVTCVKIETGRNFPPILKIVARTAQAA